MDKVGIIGVGNMGQAIAERIKSRYRVCVFDKDSLKTKNLKRINVADNIIDLVNGVNVIILAVKPQDFGIVLGEIKTKIGNKLIISIAAGISTSYLEKLLGRKAVIRVMPNLMAKIGKGIICISKGRFASKKDLVFSRRLFKNLGMTLVLKESMMNAATAISGSGPGYFYGLIEGKGCKELNKYCEDIFIPSLMLAAKSLGFDDRQAAILAKDTGLNSLVFLKRSKLSASRLKEQVASKGGTTEAGLSVLHSGGFLIQAAKAALKRAEELSRRA